MRFAYQIRSLVCTTLVGCKLSICRYLVDRKSKYNYDAAQKANFNFMLQSIPFPTHCKCFGFEKGKIIQSVAHYCFSMLNIWLEHTHTERIVSLLPIVCVPSHVSSVSVELLFSFEFIGFMKGFDQQHPCNHWGYQQCYSFRSYFCFETWNGSIQFATFTRNICIVLHMFAKRANATMWMTKVWCLPEIE